MRKRGLQGGGEGGSGNSMRWMLTYSDLITLLMVFFVVMYSMSSVDNKKYQALKSSLQSALRTDGAGQSLVMPYSGTNPIDMPQNMTGATQQENSDFQKIAAEIQGTVPDPKSVAFIVDERGLTIRFLDSMLFDLGSAELKSQAQPALNTVADSLQKTSYFVRIEGHTDNLPIKTVRYPSNWDLSAARAITVTRFLIQNHNLDPKRFSSLGYGEYRPMVANDSEANRSKNRRVDIVVLRTSKAGGEI